MVGTGATRGRLGLALAMASTLVVSLGLGACSVPRMTWSKEGVTQDELKRDQKKCLAESNSYGFLTGGSTILGNSATTARQQADIYRACMAKKGYGEQRAAPAQPGPGQPASQPGGQSQP